MLQQDGFPADLAAAAVQKQRVAHPIMRETALKETQQIGNTVRLEGVPECALYMPTGEYTGAGSNLLSFTQLPSPQGNVALLLRFPPFGAGLFYD